MVDYCKKHKDIILKNRKDKNGKYCPECVHIPCGRGKNPPWDPMVLKTKHKKKSSKKGIKRQ